MNIFKLLFGESEFREENFFVISLTVILMVVLSYNSMFVEAFFEFFRGIIIFSMIMLPFILMLFFSITKYEMEDPRFKFWILDFIVLVAMITEILFVLQIGMYLFAEFVMGSYANLSIQNVLMIVSAFINLGQALVMATVVSLMNHGQFEQFYVNGNADKKILIICAIIIFSVLILGKYWFHFYTIVSGSIAISFSTLIINVKNYLSVKKE